MKIALAQMQMAENGKYAFRRCRAAFSLPCVTVWARKKEVIRPLLGDMPHDACLIGEGSDVLGYDQPISMDHDWGPRLTLFVADEKVAVAAREHILADLPDNFLGFPARRDKNAGNIQVTTMIRHGFDAMLE